MKTADQIASLSLIWHIHQPDFIPDAEVKRQVDESYQLLINAHLKTKTPLTLNITGALLKRLTKLAPEFLKSLKKLDKLKLLELVGSGYYHPMLPILNQNDAQAQVSLDKKIKNKTLTKTLKGFWPTDLGWAPWMVSLLAEQGYEWCIVDSFSLHQSHVLPKWSHQDQNGHQILAPDLAEISFVEEQHRPYSMTLNDKTLKILVRDRELSLALSDFETGVLYHRQQIADFVKKLTNFAFDGHFLVLGEDGERVNLQTARNYELFLSLLGEQELLKIQTPSAFLNAKPKLESRYFPASTFQYGLAAWQQTMDDQLYLAYLERLSQLAVLAEQRLKKNDQPNESKKLKKAQSLLYRAEDSGHVFWKFHQRTRTPGWELLLEAENLLKHL